MLVASTGTAVACVYSVLVAFIISDWQSQLARNVFIGLAVVLIQIPACYVRSYPLYSYAGTVTGLTTAMVLLTSNATTSFAVNRIIDTYVAVVIYLVLEFVVSGTFTEDEILQDMRHVSYSGAASSASVPCAVFRSSDLCLLALSYRTVSCFRCTRA
jgi:hypothetical protein